MDRNGTEKALRDLEKGLKNDLNPPSRRLDANWLVGVFVVALLWAWAFYLIAKSPR